MAFTIRPMTKQDVAQGYALSQQLGWPHRPQDWQDAFELGHGLVVEQTGRVVATALYWCWGARYATIGLVIVDEVLRGQGLGKALFSALMAQLDGYNVRLHATPEGRALYEKFGFVAIGEIYQYQGTLATKAPEAPRPDTRIRPGRPEDATVLAALDSQTSAMERKALITHLLERCPVCVLEDKNGTALGFAALREFGHGKMLGPLVCPAPDDAIALCSVLLSEVNGEFVRVDSTGGMSDWLQKAGLQEVDRSKVMVRAVEKLPVGVGPHCFALMTQAMG